MKSPSILEKFNVKPRKNALCMCYDVFNKREEVRLNWNMYNFKFNFLSLGQLDRLNIYKISLPLLNILPFCKVFW